MITVSNDLTASKREMVDFPLKSHYQLYIQRIRKIINVSIINQYSENNYFFKY